MLEYIDRLLICHEPELLCALIIPSCRIEWKGMLSNENENIVCDNQINLTSMDDKFDKYGSYTSKTIVHQYSCKDKPSQI